MPIIDHYTITLMSVFHLLKLNIFFNISGFISTKFYDDNEIKACGQQIHVKIFIISLIKNFIEAKTYIPELRKICLGLVKKKKIFWVNL